MLPKLKITHEQFEAAMNMMLFREDIFDPVLLDERTPSGEIVTITEYDDESILIQKIKEKEGFLYNIVPREEFMSGARVL